MIAVSSNPLQEEILWLRSERDAAIAEREEARKEHYLVIMNLHTQLTDLMRELAELRSQNAELLQELRRELAESRSQNAELLQELRSFHNQMSS